MDGNRITDVAEKDIKYCINELLPDCILSHIVSMLRIKQAVETSVVSRQWRHLWKARRNLEFDIPNIFGNKYSRLVEIFERNDTLDDLVNRFDRQCFVRRMNDFLELYSGNKVDSLRVAFFFDVEATEILDRWIRFAITKGAQVLDLHLCPDNCAEFYVFPHWILSELDNASTLNHLSLRKCVLKPPADFNKFACLKTLRLNNVLVVPGFLEHVFSICVLLEGLTLMSCHVHSNLIVIGPSLHLKDLKVLQCYQLEKIEIDAVNLSSFEFGGIILTICCMKTPLLERFFFRGWRGVYGLPYAFSLLALCPGLETLYLQLLNHLENIPETVPTFGNLRQMNLDLFLPNIDLWSVLNILKAAPNLEELVITVRSYFYEAEMKDISEFSHNRLRKVKMQGFQGRWAEIEFAICILKIATKLEEMVIDPLGNYHNGGGIWEDIDYCNYSEGNENKYENEDVEYEGVSDANEFKEENVDVEPPEGSSNRNEDRDLGATEARHKEVYFEERDKDEDVGADVEGGSDANQFKEENVNLKPPEERSNRNKDKERGVDPQGATKARHKEVYVEEWQEDEDEGADVEGGSEANQFKEENVAVELPEERRNRIEDRDGGVDPQGATDARHKVVYVEEWEEDEVEGADVEGGSEANQFKEENVDVELPEGRRNIIEDRDWGVDPQGATEACHEVVYVEEGDKDEGADVEGGSEHKNEVVNEDEGIEIEKASEHENEDDGLEALEMSKDEDQDKIEDDDTDGEMIYGLEDWQRIGRAVVRERLNEIKTRARVIIL